MSNVPKIEVGDRIYLDRFCGQREMDGAIVRAVADDPYEVRAVDPEDMNRGDAWSVDVMVEAISEVQRPYTETLPSGTRQLAWKTIWKRGYKPPSDAGVLHAMQLAESFAGIDGAHHKQWLIDQMVRAIAGDEYEAFVANYEADGECEWDKGIAP